MGSGWGSPGVAAATVRQRLGAPAKETHVRQGAGPCCVRRPLKRPFPARKKTPNNSLAVGTSTPGGWQLGRQLPAVGSSDVNSRRLAVGTSTPGGWQLGRQLPAVGSWDVNSRRLAVGTSTPGGWQLGRQPPAVGSWDDNPRRLEPPKTASPPPSVRVQPVALPSPPPSAQATVAASPNPAKDWLVEESWSELQFVSSALPAFKGFAASFAKDIAHYKGYFDSGESHVYPLHGHWESTLTRLQRLILLKCLRPDLVLQVCARNPVAVGYGASAMYWNGRQPQEDPPPPAPRDPFTNYGGGPPPDPPPTFKRLGQISFQASSSAPLIRLNQKLSSAPLKPSTTGGHA